ncbi:MAG: hypothetical protein IJE07_10030 [Clostridia bacterium]|nr:hypothetical protein [Clostridia bacterium]
MSDKKRPLSGLLSDLASVVNDLYGHNAAMLDQLTRDTQGGTGINPELMRSPGTPAPTAQTPVKKGPYGLPISSAPVVQPTAAKAAAPAPQAPAAQPTLADLWKTADEPIDWTEILSGAPVPIEEKKRAVYAENAAAVLRGDQEAYLTVLHTANPMDDLMPFVDRLDVSALSADDMRATFAVREDLLADGPRRYMSSVALRIARDLFAVLPVTHVAVDGRKGEDVLLHVDFQRQELHKVRFAFVDPEAFVGQCGGEFTLPVPEQADEAASAADTPEA